MSKNDFQYSISSFVWNELTRTFSADAWSLYDIDSKYPYPFPSDKKQFYIVNKKTKGFRRFTFVKEIEYLYDIQEVDSLENDADYSFKCVDWLFESEDGIRCLVQVTVS
jgi:hypothetical protein